MLALNEFANFITLNMVDLAATFARLLAESDPEFVRIPPSNRTNVGRKLLNAASQACQQQASAPLITLFKDEARRWANKPHPANPLAEVECLGQTLTPVVTNLEAGKFLWQLLSEARSAAFDRRPAPEPPTPISAPVVTPAPTSQDITLLQLLIDTLPDQIYIKDKQSRFLLVNDTVRRLLGAASVEDVVGKTDFDFSPYDLAEQYYADEQVLFETGQSLVGHEEPIFDHETGETRWLSTTKVVFRDEQGHIAGLVGLNRDITEHKQTETDLTRFKLGIERSTDAIFLTEPDGSIIYVNSAFEKIYGYTRQEALGKTPRILKSGLIPQERYKEFWDTLLAKQVVSGEIINKTKDGRLLNIEVSNNPILDENGDLIGFLSIHRDVTARKQADDALAKRATELETVAQVSVAASTILDTDRLLQEVADLTKERFGLYHAHIYLLNPAGDTLALAAGAGEIGRQMVSEGWAIPLSKELSLVARAARSQKPVVANNVLDSTGYFPNPLLPETKSEMAVPVIAADQLLGVLDVQADTLNYFTEDQERTHFILARQVAVALRNARLYQQAQEALANVQQSQQLLRNVIDATPDWIYTKDRQFRYRLVNKAYAGTLNVTPEEFIGKNDIELGLPEVIVSGNSEKETGGLWADDAEVMDSGETKFIEAEPAVVKGHNVFLNTIKVPLKDDEDQVWGILGYVRDVTEREQLLAETRRRADESTITRNITAIMTAQTDFADNLPVVAEQLQQIVPADIFCLANYYPQQTEFTLYTVGLEKGDYFTREGVRLPLEGTGPGWVITHNEVWLEEDMRTAPQFLEDNALIEAGIVARLVMPFHIGAEAVGALYLGSVQPGAYNEDHLALMWEVADQMASVIDRLRLFEQVQQRAKREQTIREVTEKMRAATSLEQLVKITTQEIGQRFSAEYALVDLGIEPTGDPQNGNGNPT